MMEFEFKRSARRCRKTDREFRPGERYYSALVESGDGFERHDFAEAAWEGPPAGAVGWWRCRAPVAGAGRVYWAPTDVLLAYFQTLAQRPDKAETCFLMTVLLLRRRLLELIDTRDGPAGPEWIVRSPRLEGDFTVPHREIPAPRVAVLQQELSEQLFVDHPEDEADPAAHAAVEGRPGGAA